MPRYGTVNSDYIASWFQREDPGGPMWALNLMQYRDRMALIEMNSSEDFQTDEQHKDAGMEFTIVMATFPVDGDHVPPQESAADGDKVMLLQVVGDPGAPDLAEGLDATPIGRFWIEDRFIGDHRSFAEARFHLLPVDAAGELGSREFVHDDSGYAVIADPIMGEVARSLSDPTRVLF